MSDYPDELERIVAELNRAAPAPREEPSPAARAAGLAALDRLLGLAARQEASDVILVAGLGPVLRVNGSLTQPVGPPLSASDVATLLQPLLDRRRQDLLDRHRSLDFCFSREGLGRIRANVHHQRGTLAATLRLLPAEAPTIESLHLPPSLERFTSLRHGLVIVTGSTGSGKSSTLAALVGRINATRRVHIVTIEDPVEFQHANRQSVVEQIEVGQDTPDFPSALRSVLRQSPDVILVGEMRDVETMATVLTAAETGHLVFSTLHANDAPQAISRILDAFPADHRGPIRQQLSLALAGVIAQQLVSARAGSGRYPAVEILLATEAVRHLIRKGEEHQLRSQMLMGRSEGMVTMEHSLAELARAGKIAGA
ncbi:MAG: PilT/PilU family type 4a pilus ATPase [Bryobacterales bacterium]|nr:PilT/PilU family type 4a pilus ATPase [Bryobacterales bacterium]